MVSQTAAQGGLVMTLGLIYYPAFLAIYHSTISVTLVYDSTSGKKLNYHAPASTYQIAASPSRYEIGTYEDLYT